MSSRSRRAAARAATRQSTGTVTPEGNAKTRYHAPQHGACSEALSIAGESEEDLAHLAAELRQQYRPANPTERFLVDTLISNEWRIRRFRNVEAGLMPSAGPAAFIAAAPALERLQRLINACERSYHRALKELSLLQESAAAPVSEAQPDIQAPPETTAQPTQTNTPYDFLGSFRQSYGEACRAASTAPSGAPLARQTHSETA